MNFTFEIRSLQEAQEILLGLEEGREPDHLISIVNPGGPDLAGYRDFAGRKLLLRFLDLTMPGSWPGLKCPEAEDVARIIDFARGAKVSGPAIPATRW